ncbi:Rv1355c family protein [Streptomyces sp. NBC_01296]|uniref:Rv1355c family protein n=1 Tax=Streptomyces sp. NBC_01296 TaxID=2903816 RepID=UPI002E148819|nr:Rv1355c family protein [Streptomyces sp. NBC_01296]
MSLETLIGSLTAATADEDAPLRPTLYSLDDPAQRTALGALVERGEVAAVRDALAEQVAELLTARRPDWSPDPDELAAAVEAHLGGRPASAYGSWAWYPWSRQLVHVLPRDEYRELRQSRNRYKITAEEQELLTGRTIAVIGLSVGAASAVTLAQEGVGSRFRLADFDRLSLSNLNRLRASVADVGLPKVVIAARQMYEIDPHLDIEVWPQGLTEENVDAFLTGGGRADLLVEECDDLYIKVYARERARAHRIPVLMETNERGMLDVERFDREPHRPLLHGLLSGVAAADLKTLSTREKVPYVLRILDQERPSERFVPSLVEIGQTISSWPQLASGVALGAALVTDTARRLLLGTFTASGRYFVDPAELVRDGTETILRSEEPPPARAAREVAAQEAAAPLHLPEAGRPLDEEAVRRLVSYGIQAPSGGNVQPWRFVSRGRVLECRIDDDLAPTLLDFERSGSHLAIGAAVENIDLAARAAGWACRARVFPDPADPGLVFELSFTDGDDGDDGDDEAGAADGPRVPLARWIGRRTTNRAPGTDTPLAGPDADALTRCAQESGALLDLVTERDGLEEAGRILGACDRLRIMSPALHRDMMAEMRWDEEEVRRTRDGIDVATLQLDRTDLAGISIARHWPNLAFIRRIGGGASFEEGARKLVAASSAIGVLSIPGTTPDAYARGGRALQRLWLTAASRGLAVQPLTALLYLLARVERGGGAGLDPEEIATLQALRTRLAKILPHRPDNAELILVRLSYAPPPAVRSLRRDVRSCLRFAGAKGA